MEKTVLARVFLFSILFIPSFIMSKNQVHKIDTNREIVFGQSGTFSGSLGLYGNIIKNGINLYFDRINSDGGIRGKKLRLISLPDDGNPKQAEKNINQLRKQGVTMFIGNMGTRSILKVLPQIKQQSITMLFPWSGNPQLRNPNLRNIINGPGLLKPQLKTIVDYIINNIKKTKIAIFYADGNFSTKAANNLVSYLKENNITPVSVESYNRHTLKIQEVADSILKFDPKIVICISTSMPTVRLINRFFEKGNYDTQFFGIDSTLFVPNIMKYKGVSFRYSAAVPNPFTPDLAIAEQYLQDLKVTRSTEIPNVLSFSYYISAAIIVEALKNIRGPITQQSIIAEIESMKNYNIYGFHVTFNANNRHAYGNNISINKR